jgi:hypothetical protein
MVPGLIGLILGGLLGSGITALATSGNDDRRVPISRFGPGHGPFGPGFGHRGGFGPGGGYGPGGGFGNGGKGNGAPGNVAPAPQPSAPGNVAPAPQPSPSG